jgi:uncharacterized protein YdeI (YjbR/CyaY-like superfamily)
MDPNEKVCPANRAAWRRWLAKHHATSRGVWLVFYKKSTGRKGLSYDDAVEEAISFGWIDSVIRRIDDETYGQRFTPRNPKSSWSATNIRRAEKVIREGRMTEPGLARFRGAAPRVRPSAVPGLALTAELSAVLRADTQAEAEFLRLPPSHRKNYVAWVMDAKKDETRLRRLGKLIAILRTGQRPGRYRNPGPESLALSGPGRYRNPGPESLALSGPDPMKR